MSTSTSTYPQIFLTSYSTYAVSGNCLFFKSSKTTPAYAILPVFADDIASLKLSFTYRNEGASAYNGTLIVGYLSNPQDLTTFVGLDTCEQTTTKTEKKVSFAQRGISGNNYIMAFKYQGGTNDNYYLSIDDVLVDVLPECGAPEIDITGSLLTINALFTINAPQSFEIMIGDRVINIGNVTSYDLATITGLSSNTEYIVKVRSICDATTTSDWSNEKSYTSPRGALYRGL